MSPKVIDLTQGRNGEVESREIMVEEQLTLHEVEGEIVESPTKYRLTNFIVKTLEVDIVIIFETSLASGGSKTL